MSQDLPEVTESPRRYPPTPKKFAPTCDPYAIIKGLTYKPGWRIEASPYGPSARDLKGPYTGAPREPDLSYLTLIIRPAFTNTNGNGEPMDLVSTRAISLYHLQDEEAVLHYVGAAIRDVELHEVDEWLRYKGKHVQEPHPREVEHGPRS